MPTRIQSIIAILENGETVSISPASVAPLLMGAVIVGGIRLGTIGDDLAIMDSDRTEFDSDDSLSFDTEVSRAVEEEYEDTDPLDSARATLSNGPNGPMLTAWGDFAEVSRDVSYADAARFDGGEELTMSYYGTEYAVSVKGIREV